MGILQEGNLNRGFAIATEAEVQAGTNNTKGVTPFTLNSRLDGIAASNVIIVNTIDDLPTPVGDVITLPDGEYVFNQFVVDNKRFVIPAGGNVRMGIVGAASGGYIYTGTGTLFTTTDADAIEFVSFIFSATAGTLFDLSTTNANGYIFINQGLFTDINNLGTVNDLAFFLFQSTFDTIDSGITLNDNAAVKVNGANNFLWNNAASTDYFTFTGTQGQINITDLTSVPQSNESIFNIPTATTLTAGVVLNSVGYLAAGGSLFSAASKDQTDPQISLVASPPEPDSKVIGSLIWANGTSETTLLQGLEGSITAFADAGGGLVTVTSAAHGLSNGTNIDISVSTNYNGRFTISNVTTNTYDITATFNGDDATGFWESGWTKIVGTTFESELERASMPLDNRILFSNLELFRGTMGFYATVSKGTGAGGNQSYQFGLFRNGAQYLINTRAVSSTLNVSASVPSTVFLAVPVRAIDTDYFEIYVRNIDSSTNIIIESGSVIIE